MGRDLKGRNEEAMRNLVKLRRVGEDERVQLEMLDIQAEVTFHKEVSRQRHPGLQDGSRSSRFRLEFASWVDCFRRGCWRGHMWGWG